MILRRLRFRRFKKFSDWTAEFTPGLNVIFGPNEAGKSTVMEAMFTALVVDPAQPPSAFADLVRSWGEKRLGELTLEFEVDGTAYLLRKDLEAGTMLLQSQDGADRVEINRDVTQKMLHWLGLPGERAFRATAYIGQGELPRINDDRVGAQLARVLSGGGGEDVDSAIRWIHERRRHLEANGPARAGAVPERLQALIDQQRDLERQEEKARELADELQATTRRLAELDRQLEGKSAQVTTAEQQAALRRREVELQRDLQRTREMLERLEGLQARLTAVENRLAGFADQDKTVLQDLLQVRRTAHTLQQNLTTARQHLEREEATLEQLGTRHQQVRRRAGLGLIMGGLGTAAAVAGVLLALLRGAYWAYGLAAAGVLILLLGVRLRARVVQSESHYRTAEQRVLDLRRKIEQARMRAEEARTDLMARLGAMGMSSAHAMEERFASYLDVVRQQDEVRAAIQQLLGDQSRERLSARTGEMERELAEIKGRLAAFPEAAQPATASVDRIAREVQATQKEVVTLRERRAHLQGQLEELKNPSEQRHLLAEQINALQARQARDVEMLEVLDFTRRMLEEARRQSFIPARELVDRKAGEYLKLATHKGYEKVALDERSLVPRVWVPAAGGWMAPSGLSQGTADQLYLAVRLALMEVISQGKTPPLILDEPFVHFDAERLASALPLLSLLARQRQVFLFTSWLRDDLPADNLITLPVGAPASPDARGVPAGRSDPTPA